jgi:hypothetical protein
MVFKKGNRIKFLNEVGGGIVTRVDGKTVYVENDDGFEVPCVTAQLLMVEENIRPTTINTSQQKIETTDKEQKIEDKAEFDYIDLAEDSDGTSIDTSVNILLAWEKGSDRVYNIHLINDCGYHIMYVAAMIKEGTYQGIQAGALESETTIHLAKISQTDLKDISSLRFEMLFFKKGKYLPQEPMRYKLKIDEFFITDPINYTSSAYFDTKTLIHNLSEEFLMAEIDNVAIDVQRHFEMQKEHVEKAVISKKNKSLDDAQVVDLHIEQLIDNPKAFTPAEMLDIQMEYFKGVLDDAIRNKVKRIIFIHGVGNGRLKFEIHRTLDKKYPRLQYQDASFKEYGYGATLLII